jgi:spore maturation protein A
MRWLFPDVPSGHPAMGSMTMNIAANMLGLNNAATPLGLRAMEDLETLNKHPGIATNAMCTFLAINTAGVQLIPATMISIMASAGSKDPTAIIGTTIAATGTAVIAGVTAVKLLEKLPIFSIERSAKRNAS